jgi:predicted adenylyl cyclase CyaB
MLKYKDFTLKAFLKSRAKIEQKLLELGARFEGDDYQQDYYFKVSNGKLKYRKGTLGTLITHYERFSIVDIEKTKVYRYDVNPTEEEVQKLYNSFDIVGEIHKSRSLYQINNLTIHLDKLENGEEYIEVEAKDFEELYTELELQNQCQQIFEKIGISQNELLTTGYIKL